MKRPFSDVLAEISGGRIAADLTEQLAELTKAVGETGKGGFLNLKVKVEPNGDTAVTYEADIACKVPRPSYGKTMFFTDAEGGVHRRDPRQIEMQLRNVHNMTEKTSA